MSSSFFHTPLPQIPLAFFHRNRRRLSERKYTHKCLTAKMVECICQKSTTLLQGQTCDFTFSHQDGLVLSQQKLIFCLWEIIHSPLLSVVGKIQVQMLAHRFWQELSASYLLTFSPQKIFIVYLLCMRRGAGHEEHNWAKTYLTPAFVMLIVWGLGKKGKINMNQILT